MTAFTQKVSLAAVGAAAVAISGVAPAQAYGVTRFDFSGTTGFASKKFYPEYQNANFTGFFTVRTDAEDLDPKKKSGKFEIEDFLIEITNPHYKSFLAVIEPDEDLNTKSFVKLSSFSTDITNARVRNFSTNDPTVANFQLFFTDTFLNPNKAPTTAPDASTFLKSKSFLTLKGSETAPDLKIGITSAEITAIPEPTTMAGVGVFSLGCFLAKRKRKAA